MDWSTLCDCGISRSYSLTFSTLMVSYGFGATINFLDSICPSVCPSWSCRLHLGVLQSVWTCLVRLGLDKSYVIFGVMGLNRTCGEG